MSKIKLSESVVFTFGRMNPPTKGHEKLIKKVIETALEDDADHVIVLSQTQNNSTDPLEWKFKRMVCEKAFPDVYITDDTTLCNPFMTLEMLSVYYPKIKFVVGSDRVDKFKERMIPYAKNTLGVDLEIISAGDRVITSRGIAGISSSKMRAYATGNKAEKFVKGLPDTLTEHVKTVVLKNTIKGLKKPNK